jgi:hypothetical protein
MTLGAKERACTDEAYLYMNFTYQGVGAHYAICEQITASLAAVSCA